MGKENKPGGSASGLKRTSSIQIPINDSTANLTNLNNIPNVTIGAGGKKESIEDAITRLSIDSATLKLSVQSARKPGVPHVNFNYFRFQCLDIKRTREFYKTLGLNQETSWENQSQIFLSLSMSSERSEGLRLKVCLQFEFSKNIKVEALKENVNASYIVFYTRIIELVVSQLKKNGFRIFLPLQKIFETRMCIAVDPNGIMVRLIEVHDGYLECDRSITSKWLIWLGYVVVPVKDAEKTAKYFENMFSVDNNDASIGKFLEETKNVDINHIPSMTDLKAQSDKGANEKMNEGAKRDKEKNVNVFRVVRNGFHIIDKDLIKTGNTANDYYFLGINQRDGESALCLASKSSSTNSVVANTRMVGSMLSSWAARHETGAFLGIGVLVPDLHEALEILKEWPDLNWTQKHIAIPDVGFFARFYDSRNHCFSVDLVAMKDTYFSLADTSNAVQGPSEVSDKIMGKLKNRLFVAKKHMQKDEPTGTSFNSLEVHGIQKVGGKNDSSPKKKLSFDKGVKGKSSSPPSGDSASPGVKTTKSITRKTSLKLPVAAGKDGANGSPVRRGSDHGADSDSPGAAGDSHARPRAFSLKRGAGKEPRKSLFHK
eukprot:Nk52_evm28s250 gene=Nk52_evmTU28s250